MNSINDERNKLMDEIIRIEEKLMPELLRQKREILGKISVTQKKRNLVWVKIKELHKRLQS